MRAILGFVFLGLTVCAAARPVAAEPLAWIQFNDASREKYLGTPYHFLGDAEIRLTIDVAPAAGHALDVLWGSKNDRRGAVVEVGGNTLAIRSGGYNGFRWLRVALPDGIAGDKYDLRLRAADPKAAFIAAVCLVRADAAKTQLLPRATAHKIRFRGDRLQELIAQLAADHPDTWQRAAIHGEQANETLRRCRKYVDGWLAHADPKSGLIPRNLKRDRLIWNGKDSAADNYPFMVLTCALTDRKMFDGRMLDMLRTEQKVTSRLDNLVDVFSFKKQTFLHDTADLNRMVFDSSEYVKDGLLPLTEWLGESPWRGRMVGIVDSILKHASHKTPGGPIPSDSVEVNGEMMQALSRVYFMTRDSRYLDMACRIGDYYLLGNHHPTRDLPRLRLDDHSCELVSGLTEVYVACHFARPEKKKAYRKPIHEMLDRILEVGLNEDGFMVDTIDPRSGRVLRKSLTDNWGYNYNGYYTVHMVDGVPRYRDAVVRVLRSLRKKKYLKYPWEGWGSDGIADCVEGAINLYNRKPVDCVPAWLDANIRRMLLIQKPDGVIEGWHGDGNYARTAIMYALWKTAGATLRPWRSDVRVGAVQEDGDLYLTVAADKAWTGRLVFDRPRHKTQMGLPLDYPRINQFPEWFTVDAEKAYEIRRISDRERTPRELTGGKLAEGLSIKLTAGDELRLMVSAKQEPKKIGIALGNSHRVLHALK